MPYIIGSGRGRYLGTYRSRYQSKRLTTLNLKLLRRHQMAQPRAPLLRPHTRQLPVMHPWALPSDPLNVSFCHPAEAIFYSHCHCHTIQLRIDAALVGATSTLPSACHPPITNTGNQWSTYYCHRFTWKNIHRVRFLFVHLVIPSSFSKTTTGWNWKRSIALPINPTRPSVSKATVPFLDTASMTGIIN